MSSAFDLESGAFDRETRPAGVDTVLPVAQAPAWALVLLTSDSEPHRVGEVAFLPSSETSLLGRGAGELEGFVCFAPQRPGLEHAARAPEDLIGGIGISRRQLVLRATAAGVEMERIGRCPTFVNGEEKAHATLAEGDTLRLGKEALLLCVKRRRTLSGPPPRYGFGEPDEHGLIGESPAAWALREDLARAAASEEHVLVVGETGTGKELVAHALHAASRRAKGRLVIRSAPGVPDAYADRVLFGDAANHPEPGMAARPPLVGGADGGTLFLDQIGDCSRVVQGHLLPVLETGEYRIPGEDGVRRVDARVVGATLADCGLLPAFRARFRCTIRLPPLRERREDIPLLIRRWMLEQARERPERAGRFLRAGGTDARVSGRLVDDLVRRPLTGNVRELNARLNEAVGASLGDEVKLPPAWSR
jgi:two-component system, NtrC family, response regulator HydG